MGSPLARCTKCGQSDAAAAYGSSYRSSGRSSGGAFCGVCGGKMALTPTLPPVQSNAPTYGVAHGAPKEQSPGQGMGASNDRSLGESLTSLPTLPVKSRPLRAVVFIGVNVLLLGGGGYLLGRAIELRRTVQAEQPAKTGEAIAPESSVGAAASSTTLASVAGARAVSKGRPKGISASKPRLKSVPTVSAAKVALAAASPTGSTSGVLGSGSTSGGGGDLSSATAPVGVDDPMAPGEPRGAAAAETTAATTSGGELQPPPPATVPAATAPPAEPAPVEVKIDVDEIVRIFARNQEGLNACYQRELKRDPALSGDLELSLTIGLAGRATRASITSDTTGSQPLGECLVARVKEWDYPKPTGGSAELVWPMHFEPVQ